MPYDPNRHHRRSIRLRGYDYRQPEAYFVTICTQGRQHLFGAADGGVLRLNDAGSMVARWWGALHDKFPTISTDAFVVMPDHIHGIIVIAAPGDVGRVDGIADIDAINAGGYTNPPLRDDIDDTTASNGITDRNADDDTTASNAITDPTAVGADGSIRPRRSPNDRDDRNAGDVGDAGGDMDAATPAAVLLPRTVQWFKIMTTTEYIRHVKQSGWPPFDQRVWQRGYWEHIIRDTRKLNAVRQYIAANPARRDDLDVLLARMQAQE